MEKTTIKKSQNTVNPKKRKFLLKKTDKKNNDQKKKINKVVQIRRVSKTTKGGKNLTFSAVVIVGDESGKVGIGLGRAKDVSLAIKKAVSHGKKNLIQIPLTENNSIPHAVQGKFGASKVLIKPAKAGTGVIAGGPVRTVLELAGIRNILAKQLGSNNIINNSRATLSALLALQYLENIYKERSIPFNVFRKRILKK